MLPRTLVLLTRMYPLQYWCRTTRQFSTAKAQAAAQQQSGDRQGQVSRNAQAGRAPAAACDAPGMPGLCSCQHCCTRCCRRLDYMQAYHAAAAAVHRAELQQCKAWAAASSGASTVERAYAAAVLSGAGGCCDDDGGGAGSCRRELLWQLQEFRAAREAHLERQRTQQMQQLLQAQAASGGGGAGGSSGATAGSDCLEPPVPVLRMRVAGVGPPGSGPAGAGRQALLKVWRPCEAVQQLDEGSVLLATGLLAGSDGRSTTVDLGGLGCPMLELATTKHTRRVLGAVTAVAQGGGAAAVGRRVCASVWAGHGLHAAR